MLAAEAVDRLDPSRARAAARLRARVRAGSCPPRERPTAPAPIPSATATPPRTHDAALSRRLRAVARTFGGISGVWVHDLASGRYGQWNGDARFPAASLVKLGVAVAWGRDDYDVAAMLRWSSNLAANRLLGRVGAGAVTAALRKMGAPRSTYTGPYRIGTSRVQQPPAISARVTTARDVGRMLYWLQKRQDRTVLGHLLASEPFKANVGILRPVDRAAQKHGWFSAVRHSAALVYAEGAPTIVVVLTYAPRLTLARARRYGAQVMRAAGLETRATVRRTASAAAAPLEGKTVVLDPGHNPTNWKYPTEINRQVNAGTHYKACDTVGAQTAGGYSEAEYNWDVVVRLRAILWKQGARVLLTRRGRTVPPWGPCITERAEAANRERADVALSVHADGGPASGRGFHVIYPPSIRGLTDDIAARSRLLALDVRRAFARTGMPRATYIGSEGLDVRSDLGGLNLSDVPKVFVETGNMQNADDARLLTSARFRQRAAQALARAVGAYLSRPK